MVATAAFVLAFVVIALGVLSVAMRAGHRNAPKSQKPTSSARDGRMTTAMLLAAVILGVGIPVLILANNHGAQAKDGPGGIKLTATERQGRHLFAQNCATCHTLDGANAVGKVGPNLDQLRPPKALVTNAIQLGRARGQGQMPAMLLSGQDANDVATFVSSVAGR